MDKASDFESEDCELESRRGRYRMVVGFTTTCAISVYQYQSYEFVSHSWRYVLDTTLCAKVFRDLGQVGGFLRVLWFPLPIKLTVTI